MPSISSTRYALSLSQRVTREEQTNDKERRRGRERGEGRQKEGKKETERDKKEGKEEGYVFLMVSIHHL